MSIEARYVFIASMDVEPAYEALFNEVYDTEHIWSAPIGWSGLNLMHGGFGGHG